MEVEIKTGGGRFTFKKPMSDVEKRGFMANLSKQASQLGGGAQAVQRPAAPRPPAPASADDFPFGANAPQQQYKL